MALHSRKHFLIGAATLTGAAVTSAVFAGEAKAANLPTYGLDPEWNAGSACSGEESTKSRGCHGCRACHLHAANTLFASAEDADLYRAHPGCKCVVVEGLLLPHDTWLALFGLPNAIARPHVDRRTQWVADVLAAAAIPLTLSSNSTLTKPSETLPTPPPNDVRVPVAASGQLRVRTFRVGRMGREVLIDLDLSGPAAMQVRLLAGHDRVVVKRHYAATEGASRYRFKVPNGIRPGRYSVQLALRSGQGPTRTLRSPFVIHAPTK